MDQPPTAPNVVSESTIVGRLLKHIPQGPFRTNQFINAFLLIGLLCRCIRYLLCFPLWEDECFLCVNLIDRGYSGLTEGLNYCQVAPILFLWIEKTCANCLGFNEFSLRLFPFVCSIVSLFLFRHVAGQLLRGTALITAVGLFSVSYPGIRYAAEAKQYASDALVGLIILSITVTWWIAFRANQKQRGIWILAAFIPLALALSFPALFAAGGACLFIAVELLRRSICQRQSVRSLVRSALRDPNWHAWILCNLGILISFAFLLVWAKQNHNVKDMDHYWYITYPPLTKPIELLTWFIQTHTGDLMAYPVGGGRGASTLTFLCVAIGIARLLRAKRTIFLALLLFAPALHLIAASLQRYPYGGHVKFSQYMSGPICILIAIGVTSMLTWLSRRRGFSVGTTSIVWLGLFGVGIASIGRDFISPWKTESDQRARSFARSFWLGTHYAEEVLCVKDDLGLDFVPDQYLTLSWAAQYRCYRLIEMNRWSLHSADLSRVSASRQLRCVMYRDDRFKLDQAKLDQWLAEMKLKYDLVSHECLPLARMTKDNRRLVTMEYVDSYRFVPRDTAVAERTPLPANHD